MRIVSISKFTKPDLVLVSTLGGPIVSRLTGERMLPFSRRINKPDGTFGRGRSRQRETRLLYAPVQADRSRSGWRDHLYLDDGTRIMRHPYGETDIGVTSQVLDF